MTDPFNDHTSDPTIPPTSESPIEAAAAAAADAPPPVDPTLPIAPVAAVDEKPKGPSFAELGLHADVLRAIEEMGFADPMPVQSATLPLIRDGRDLMVQSRTGSGKTAAFGIPFANGIVNGDDKFVQAIVLLPTRELALQVAAELAKISPVPGHDGRTRVRRRADGTPGRAAARGRPDRVRHAGARARPPAPRHAEAGWRPLRRARRVRRDAVDGLPGGHRIHPGEDAGRRGRRCCSRRRCPRGSSGWRGGSCARPSS